MKIDVNGELREVDGELSVEALLERLGLARRRVAVAINARVVPRSTFPVARVREGDRVEVIQAVGGG